MNDTVQIPFVDSDASMDRETVAMLAGNVSTESAGVSLSPVYPGTIALLDLIDSPFVQGGKRPAMLDLYRALYVIERREDAVAPVIRAIREAEALEAAEKLADKGETYYAAYLTAMREAAKGWQEFDMEACRHAERLGVISHVKLCDAIAEAINSGTAGFRMIHSDGAATAGKESPPTETAQKKSTAWERIGWRHWWREFVRLVPLCGRMM